MHRIASVFNMRLVYLTLGWAAGIILVESSNRPLAFAWFIFLGVALIGAWLNGRSNWRWLSFAIVAFTLGGLRASFLPQTSPVAAYNNLGGLTIEGRVIAEPDIRDHITLLRLRTETLTRAGQTVRVRGDVLVRAPRTTDATYGDTVRATGLLVMPGEFDNFSYADYLARWNIYSILRDSTVEVTERGGGNAFYRWLLAQKQNAAHTINTSMPEPMAGLLVGILLGNERGISPELQDDFAATGAAHIVAISGFNMVILAGVIERLLEKTPISRLWVGIISVAVIGVYTVFVGGDAAVVRAAVMSGVLVVGRALNRKTYVPASLAFVALIMSVIHPRVLWSVSFQLSFFATLGLALFADSLTRWFNMLLARLFPVDVSNRVSNFLAEPLIVTIAALIPTLPLTALYFNRVSLVQLPVNLLIVPVQAAVLISGIAATLVHMIFPPLAQLIYWFDMALVWWSVSVVRVFANLPSAEIEFYTGSEPISGFFLILIIGAMIHATQPEWARRLWRFLSSQAVFSSVMFVALVVIGLNVASIAALPDGRLHVYMLDVGHSNGVFIQTPRGAQILIDGGRFPSRLLTQIGDRMPYNDRHIELIVVTQPDEIQYGALPAVLSRYRVGAVLTNGQPNLSDAYNDLQVALAPYGVQTVTAGYSVNFDDGVRLDVLAPYETPELTASLDANAVVLRLTYGDASFLFTGDLSVAGQQALLERDGYPEARVMQMPQHGTQRSIYEEFLAQVNPQVVLIQSDRANLRGDPHPDTLALLDDEIDVFRTDEMGVIHIATDGKHMWVR